MSAALDASARALARRLLREHPPSRPYARPDLDALPGPVARLLAADLDGHVERAAPDTPWVDAAAPAVREATRQWREAARDAARIPADAWEAAVERAARLAVAHLVRPAETLAAYTFDDEEGPMPAAQALRRAEAFGPYPYLPDIAGRYVERKALDQIDRPGLERLLRRIDQRMVSSFGPAEWADLFAPLIDLVGPDGTPRGSVPAALLRELAEAKDAPALAAALDTPVALTADALRQRMTTALGETTERPAPPAEEAPAGPGPPHDAPADEGSPGAPAPDEPVQEAPAADATPEEGPAAEPSPGEGPVAARAPEAPSVPPEDPARPAPPVIGSQYRTPDDEHALDSDIVGAPRPAAPREEAAPSAGGLVFGSPPDAGDTAAPPEPPWRSPEPPPTSPPALDAEDEPIWRRFARDQGSDLHATAAGTPGEEEAPLWQRFVPTDATDATQDAGAVGAETPLPADAVGVLEGRVLGSNPDERREWFVQELFSGSPDAYHRTLAALDDARTWTEATQIIGREVFRTHGVNIYSEPAVAFTDAVEARMTARGKG